MSEITGSVEISIIIVSYNNVEILRQTIKSILENITGVIFEVIIVDNASLEDNVEMIRREFPKVKVIVNKNNVGFGHANNQGSKIAKGSFLFFVNGDVLLIGNPFNKMVEFYRSTKNIGLFGAQLLNLDLTRQQSFYNFPSITRRIIELSGLKKWLKFFYPTCKKTNKSIFSVAAIKGAFFLVSKEKFNLLGKFDEKYFMYVEDVDLSFQSINAGYKNYLFNNDIIIHLGENHEMVTNLFLFKNRNKGLIYFYKKNYSSAKPYIFILISLIFFLFKYLKASLLQNKIIQNNYKVILHLYLKSLLTKTKK